MPASWDAAKKLCTHGQYGVCVHLVFATHAESVDGFLFLRRQRGIELDTFALSQCASVLSFVYAFVCIYDMYLCVF